MRSGMAPILVSVSLVGTLGLVHGLATDRWGPSNQLEQALATLERVPAAFGDWSGEDVEYKPEEMVRGGIKGCVYRRYRNLRTRDSVMVLLVCGRGGPISVHTPDVCYAGAGYRPTAHAMQKDIDLGASGKHTFRVGRYAKPDGVSQTQLEIYLAWSRDGRTWEAPQDPRLSLARSQALYKLYVVREFVPNTRTESAESCYEFVRRALPDLGQKLPPNDQ
jgi:hypothetical protein